MGGQGSRGSRGCSVLLPLWPGGGIWKSRPPSPRPASPVRRWLLNGGAWRDLRRGGSGGSGHWTSTTYSGALSSTHTAPTRTALQQFKPLPASLNPHRQSCLSTTPSLLFSILPIIFFPCLRPSHRCLLLSPHLCRTTSRSLFFQRFRPLSPGACS